MSAEIITAIVMVYIVVGFLSVIPAIEAKFSGKATIATVFLWPLALGLVLFAGAKEIYERVL